MSNPHIAPALECLDPEGDFCWENSDLANIGARIEAQTQATLDLAYETRTANLLALHQTTIHALTNGFELGAAGTTELDDITQLIETRLGLGDTK